MRAVDQRAEPLRLSGRTLTGETLDLEDLRGRVVVVNVWGSWCGPCRAEAPVLATVARDYRNRGVSFIGISVKDNPGAARAFERRFGTGYPSIDDSDGSAQLALRQVVPLNAVPSTVVLDRSGRAAAAVLGEVALQDLQDLLDRVLREPR